MDGDGTRQAPPPGLTGNRPIDQGRDTSTSPPDAIVAAAVTA
jgi:hypothetical protein